VKQRERERERERDGEKKTPIVHTHTIMRHQPMGTRYFTATVSTHLIPGNLSSCRYDPKGENIWEARAVWLQKEKQRQKCRENG